MARMMALGVSLTVLFLAIGVQVNCEHGSDSGLPQDMVIGDAKLIGEEKEDLQAAEFLWFPDYYGYFKGGWRSQPDHGHWKGWKAQPDHGHWKGWKSQPDHGHWKSWKAQPDHSHWKGWKTQPDHRHWKGKAWNPPKYGWKSK